MSETLAQIGEKQLLQLLKRYLRTDAEIIRIFSEDCAVIDTGGAYFRLYTVDVLVEGVHFQREYMSGYVLGRKALKVNLSDIGAMGGIPEFYLVSLAAPGNTPVRLIEDMYKGMDETAREYGVRLVGGNVSTSNQLLLEITMVGKVKKKQIVRRDGAQKGDSLFVSGQLGGSAEGLNLLREGFRLIGNGLILPKGQRDSHLVIEAIQNHIDPPCSVKTGNKLAQTSMVTSMIDLSDGVAADLAELCRESRVGARIDLQSIPIASSVLYWERKRNHDPRILALFGGEDYHLLFTVAGNQRAKFMDRMQKQNITVYEIGKIVPRSRGIQVRNSDGSSFPLEGGYQHFQ